MGYKVSLNLKLILSIIFSPVELFFLYLPGPLGYLLRYSFYKRKMKYLGRNVIIDEGVRILNPEYVSIDDNTWVDKHVILIAGEPRIGKRKILWKKNDSFEGRIGELIIGRGCHIAPNVIIQAHGGVKIGDHTGVAAGAKIYSMSHHYRNLVEDDDILYKFTPRAPEIEQFLIIGPVVLEDNTCLALNSVVLPGVTIGKNSWIGVNSYVIKDIPSDSIATGSPAEVIRKR